MKRTKAAIMMLLLSALLGLNGCALSIPNKSAAQCLNVPNEEEEEEIIDYNPAGLQN